MYVIQNPVAAMNMAGIATLIGVASIQAAAVQRLSALNVSVARSAYKQSISYANSLLSAKDAHGFASLSTTAAQPAIETAIAYLRGAWEIWIQMQAEMKKFAEAQAGYFIRNSVGCVDKNISGQRKTTPHAGRQMSTSDMLPMLA